MGEHIAVPSQLLETMFSMWFVPRLYKGSSERPTEQLTDSQMQWGVEFGAEATGISCHHELVMSIMRLLEHRSRGTSSVGICYRAMTDEDIENCMCTAVHRFVK
jgi:hypothetical protein